MCEACSPRLPHGVKVHMTSVVEGRTRLVGGPGALEECRGLSAHFNPQSSATSARSEWVRHVLRVHMVWAAMHVTTFWEPGPA